MHDDYLECMEITSGIAFGSVGQIVWSGSIIDMDSLNHTIEMTLKRRNIPLIPTLSCYLKIFSPQKNLINNQGVFVYVQKN